MIPWTWTARPLTIKEPICNVAIKPYVPMCAHCRQVLIGFQLAERLAGHAGYAGRGGRSAFHVSSNQVLACLVFALPAQHVPKWIKAVSSACLHSSVRRCMGPGLSGCADLRTPIAVLQDAELRKSPQAVKYTACVNGICRWSFMPPC